MDKPTKQCRKCIFCVSLYAPSYPDYKNQEHLGECQKISKKIKITSKICKRYIGAYEPIIKKKSKNVSDQTLKQKSKTEAKN